MVYEQFLAAVKKRMEAELGSSYELELHKVPKTTDSFWMDYASPEGMPILLLPST